MRLCREQRLAPDSEMGTLGDLDSQKVRKRVPCNPGCASESVESSIKKKKKSRCLAFVPGDSDSIGFGWGWESLQSVVCINCYSIAELCPSLCDHMNCHSPGSLVLHNLLEFAQIHVR